MAPPSLNHFFQSFSQYLGCNKLSDDDNNEESVDLQDYNTPQTLLEKRWSSYQKSPAALWRRYTLAGIGLAITFGLLLVTISKSRRGLESFSNDLLSHQAPNTDILKSPCGDSVAKARSLGCHFDIITFCWLPDRCFDAELSSTFDELSDWEWYRDQNKTQPVAKAEALSGELDGLWVSWEYHVQHCVFMWEKMHRAILGEGKRAIDGYIGPYMHTQHCGKMLLSRGKGFELEDMNTRIRVKFPDCGVD